MKNISHRLLVLIAGATQKELAGQIRYLKIENEILGSKLPTRVAVPAQEEQAGKVWREARQVAGRTGVDRSSQYRCYAPDGRFEVVTGEEASLQVPMTKKIKRR